jgi:hypothetical protein
MEISSFSMGLDEPSFKQQTDGRSVERRKEEADKNVQVRDLDEERRNNKKRGPSHATQQQRPGCADWPSILSQKKKKKKLRNDAPCKKKRAKPI